MNMDDLLRQLRIATGMSGWTRGSSMGSAENPYALPAWRLEELEASGLAERIAPDVWEMIETGVYIVGVGLQMRTRHD